MINNKLKNVKPNRWAADRNLKCKSKQPACFYLSTSIVVSSGPPPRLPEPAATYTFFL